MIHELTAAIQAAEYDKNIRGYAPLALNVAGNPLCWDR
jgi:hypothetical protein